MRTIATRLPVLVLLFSASLWGLGWWPLKQFAAAGLSGPVLTLLTYGLVGLCTSFWLWRERAAWRAQAGVLLGIVVIGGWANTAFVWALVIGDVVRVMLLFYLSPVWSVLGGRLFLGEPLRPRRQVAIATALLGLWLVLGGSHAFDSPLSKADLLALSAGLAFAGNNLLARAGQRIPIGSKTVAVFVGCGVMSMLLMALQGLALPPASLLASPLGLSVLAYGFIWLVIATATWQYGVTHIESGRAGIVLVVELLVAVLSASWVAGTALAPAEWLGGALIAIAALLEATDNSAEVIELKRAH